MAIPLPSTDTKTAIDYSAKAKDLLPFEATGRHTCTLLAFRFNPACDENQNKANFRAKFRIDASTNPEHVGRTYQYYFPVGRPGKGQGYDDARRRQFLGALAPTPVNIADPSVKTDPIQQDLVDLTDAGVLDTLGRKFMLSRQDGKPREVPIKDSKGNVLATETKTYTDDVFFRAE